MTSYTAHIQIGNGHADSIIALECVDDVAALQAAEALVDGHDIALWSGFRKLGTLHHDMRTKPADKAIKGIVLPSPPAKKEGGL
jgi:hypothetical protein